ncbi:hypothetical protein M1D55_04610 [Cupriavidus sp. JZ107]
MMAFLLAASLLLLIALPPFLLQRFRSQTLWWPKYVIALAPGMLTLAGWKTAAFLQPFLDCKGGPKNLHACNGFGVDLTWLTDFRFFMMLACILVATPLSFWLTVRTFAEHFALKPTRNAEE